jgi:Zinc finger, C2H2 type
MVDVRQCPYCELRFPTKVELEHHIATDHPGHLGTDDVDDDTRRPSDGGA